MNYEEAVRLAAEALVTGENCNWELARLTWENTQTRHKEPDRMTMADWCAAIRERSGRRFSERTGKLYRAIWQEHGQVPAHTLPNWTEVYYESSSSGRTYQEERDLIERKTIERIETIATPEQKREVVTRLLADPEIADTVMAERDTRQAIYGAMQRKEQRAEVRNETIRASDPVIQRLDRETALLDLEKLMRTTATDGRALLAAIGTLPERSPGAVAPHLFLRQSFVALEDFTGGVRTLLTTGTNDLDHFLDSVLKGEQ